MSPILASKSARPILRVSVKFLLFLNIGNNVISKSKNKALIKDRENLGSKKTTMHNIAKKKFFSK